MPQNNQYTRAELENADLVVDAVYQGTRAGNAGDDPLGPLLGVSNQGGFRHLGRKESPNLIVITSSMNEPDWPDHLDAETGIFTYFGDNRLPGRGLHDTPRWGNTMLRDTFHAAHGSAEERRKTPPVLVFSTAGIYRDVRFLGLAVPGAVGVPATQDLTATWHNVSGQRFQNYRGLFTILAEAALSRAWIRDVQAGNPFTKNAPASWLAWIDTGAYRPLRSVSTRGHRTREEQLPVEREDKKMLAAIYGFFKEDPYGFEECAARIAETLLQNVTHMDITRPFRDGGRDAVGLYKIGFDRSSINVDFALEAKCYADKNSVGVKETARLISRLRHRQFGILVTTSYVNLQAYKEILEDEHPVLIVSGIDVVSILKRAGIRDSRSVEEWLNTNFSK